MKNKNNNEDVKNVKKTPEKKEAVKFIYKAKNSAKKNNISYDLRVTSYNVSNNNPYSYGIR